MLKSFMPIEELTKMAKWVSIFIFSLLLLRVAGGRTISADSDSHRPVHGQNPSSHVTASPEQSRLNDEDGHCKGLDREECLVRKTMVAHTDYIYTQDINGP